MPAEERLGEVLLPWVLAAAVAGVVRLVGGLPEWASLARAQTGAAGAAMARLVELRPEGGRLAVVLGNSRMRTGLLDARPVERALEAERGGDWAVAVVAWPNLAMAELLQYERELRAAAPELLLFQWDNAYPARCRGGDDHDRFEATIAHHEDFERAGPHDLAALELMLEARRWGAEIAVVEMPDRAGLRAALSPAAIGDRERTLLRLVEQGARPIRSSAPWDPALFEDFVHLDAEGAAVFAEWLAPRLAATGR